MKIYCAVCNIHFVDEFEATLKTPCNFWGDMGMGNLEVDLKKKLWDWLFTMPSDEIGLKSGIGIALTIGGVPIQEESKFENIIPGYIELNDEEKKLAQKQYFKNKQHTKQDQSIINKTERTVH